MMNRMENFSLKQLFLTLIYLVDHVHPAESLELVE